MKTIGMLGGMSWESTASYYSIINTTVKKSLGGLHSADIILKSVDFAPIERMQTNSNWAELASILSHHAAVLQQAGANCLIICTNTMHKVAPSIEEKITIPLLHIADATAVKLTGAGIQKTALLGTRFTMEQDFYKKRMEKNYGLQVITPPKPERKKLHHIIYKELCKGVITSSSKTFLLEVINKLNKNGAESVILGCTEIALLVQQQDTPVSLFDTTEIHAKAAARFAMKP